MKNNKGFTLVELLAVIIVLAIILTIALPSITNVIKSSTKASFKSDAKMLLQAIEYKKLENENFNPLEVTKENMQTLVGINSINYNQVNITVTDGTINVMLVGDNVWDGFTAYGTIKNMKVVNTENYDLIPPSITILGDNPANIGRGTIYTDASATATDLEDGNISISSIVIRDINNTVVSSIDTSTFTTYTITYTAEDINGNQSSAIRRVNIVDKIPPTLTILGDNPQNINVGSIYTDSGATALDDIDGDITSNIVTTGTVNPSALGVYEITYSVIDSSGNEATATRVVNVIDETLPTATFSMNGNLVYSKNRSTTVVVNDLHSGVNESNLKYQWNSSVSIPSTESFITPFTNGDTLSTPVGVTGTYYLWILSIDNAGNMNIEKSNAFNLDNTKPVITIVGESVTTVELGSSYSDAGATANDSIDGNLTANINTTSTVNTSISGTYTVTYNVTDSSGNVGTPQIRTVNVLKTINQFSYTGAVQTWTVSLTGTYRIELWGAGLNGKNSNGAYTKGDVILTQGTAINIYVGGQGNKQTAASYGGGGYNGGGNGYGGTYGATYLNSYGGGGATDIRVGGTASKNRIMVAGGAGHGSPGGGITSGDSLATSGTTSYNTYGATQTAGGIGKFNGTFGTGGNSEAYSYGYGSSGGGGGYYGGGGGYSSDWNGSGSRYYAGFGTGGSSFISGYTGCNAVNSSGVHTGQPNHYSGYVFTSGVIIDGDTVMPSPAGGTETGHPGNGYVKITYLP